MTTKKMRDIKTAPRIHQSTADGITQIFETLNQGAEFILEAWPGIYRRTLRQIAQKGIFTRGELMLMIDVSNATMLLPHILGQHMQVQVEDACDLDALDKKWEIRSKDQLIGKLACLSIFEMAALELWAWGFWYAAADHLEYREGIETYVTEFLGTDGTK